MREVKHAIRSLNANMEVIQEGIPEILQRTDAIQNAALNISSTLKTRLERTCQPIALPELKNYMETLPQMIENRVIVRLDDHIKQIVEIFQTPQLTNSQRSAKIQKNVSRAIFLISDTKFRQGTTRPYCSGKITREAEPFARYL